MLKKEPPKRVFLGGTFDSTWRNRMVIYLHEERLDYFNPVVEDWDTAAQLNELRERENCDFCLYTLTPKMTGCYAVAEVIDDSNKCPEKTVLVLLRTDGYDQFGISPWKSLMNVAQMVKRNGGQVFDDLKLAAIWMGEQARK